MRLLRLRWLAISVAVAPRAVSHRHLVLAPTEGIHSQFRTPPWSALASGQEHLDLVRDGVGVTEPWPVVRAGQFDVRRGRQVLGQVSRVIDMDPRVARAMQDQDRLRDRRQQIADVHTHVHPNDVLCHRRAGRHPQVASPPHAVCARRRTRSVCPRPTTRPTPKPGPYPRRCRPAPRPSDRTDSRVRPDAAPTSRTGRPTGTAQDGRGRTAG